MNQKLIGSVVLGLASLVCPSVQAAGEKVELCHIPSESADNAHTIIVSVKAQASHEAHGDTLGPCASDVSACPCNDSITSVGYGWSDGITTGSCTVSDNSAQLLSEALEPYYNPGLVVSVEGEKSTCVVTEYLFLDINETEAIACKNEIQQYALNDNVNCDTF